MSTRDEIRAACDAKPPKLHFVPPNGRGERHLFVAPTVWEVVKEPWARDDIDGIRFANMRAGMDVFSRGMRVTIAMEPHKKKSESFLAPVRPVTSRCWDMRFTAPLSRLRCLGFFAEFNCFIGLVWDFRENFLADPDWAAGVAECERLWSQIFTTQPLTGSARGDFISKPFEHS